MPDSWRIHEQSPDPGGLPRWPLKATVPVAFALLALQGVSEVIKRALFLRGVDRESLGLDEPAATRDPDAASGTHGGGA